MRAALLFGVTFLCAAPAADNQTMVDRVGSTGFVQLASPSFQKLPLKEQALAYWLTQASIAVDPIIYDQNSIWGLRQKRLMEEILRHPAGVDPLALGKIADFTKLFWANRGNHNDTTAQKFLPEFSFEDLKTAAAIAMRNGGFKGLPYGVIVDNQAGLDRELEALRPSLFDAKFAPMITAKNPQGNLDILQSSANNFYYGLSMADLKNFHDKYPLNSRLTKSDMGNLVEEVYRAGTPDGKVKPGMYAKFLGRAVEYLEKARPYADPGQKEAITELIRYYQTGDPAAWIRFGIAWVQNDAVVDFDNGFIEIYRDARGAKGSSQSFVSITDQPTTQTMIRLGQNADYFERQAPWDARYRSTSFKPPVIKAV